MARTRRTELIIFFVFISMAALGNGLSDSVYANFFKDAYNVTTIQRGFIEFPRELPGVLCALVMAGLSVLGDMRTAFIAQLFSLVGLTALGLFTPSFGVMLIFLFINSMGMHMLLPLGDSIGMSLAEPNMVGRRMGQYASVRSAVGFFAGILVFVGFRFGFFTFKTQIKPVFLIGSVAFLLAAGACLVLIFIVKPARAEKKRFQLCLKREYAPYYFLTILRGVQKQITIVYGTWVIIDMLLKGADIMALLIIASSFLGVFFMHQVGKWTDRFGIRSMMFFDALSFIGVYVAYGLMVWGVQSGVLPNSGWAVFVVYALFVLDRLSMQVGMVKSVYLKSILVDGNDLTPALSTGISLDHVVSIIAAILGGYIWTSWGSQWVFFLAAALSLGNLYVAFKIKKTEVRHGTDPHP